MADSSSTSPSSAPHHLPHPAIKFTFKGASPPSSVPSPAPGAPSVELAKVTPQPTSHSSQVSNNEATATPEESGADDGMSSMGVTEDDGATDRKGTSTSGDESEEEGQVTTAAKAATVGEPTSFDRSSSSASSVSPPPSTSYPVRTHSLSTLKSAPSPLSSLAVDAISEAPIASTPGVEVPVIEGFFNDDDAIAVTFPPSSPFDLLNKNAVASTSSLLHLPVDLAKIPIPVRFSLPHKFIPFNPATSFIRPHDQSDHGYEPPLEDYGYFASPEQLEAEKERAAVVAKEREERKRQREEELASFVGWKKVKAPKKPLAEASNGVLAKGWTGVSALAPVAAPEEKDVKKWKNHTRFRKALTATLFVERTGSPNGLPPPEPSFEEGSPFRDLDKVRQVKYTSPIDFGLSPLPVPEVVKRIGRGSGDATPQQNGHKRTRTVTEESTKPQRKRKKTEKLLNRDSEEPSSTGEEPSPAPSKRVPVPRKPEPVIAEPKKKAVASSIAKAAAPPPPSAKAIIDVDHAERSKGEDSAQDAGSSPVYDENVVPYEYQLQHTSCLSKKSKGQVLCHQCTSRRPGRGCSFQGRRFFPVDERGNLVGAPVFRDTTITDDKVEFGESFVTTPDLRADMLDVKDFIATGVHTIVKQELAHAHIAIKAPLDLAETTSCDTCLQTLSGSFMCKRCGREACFKCMKALIDLEAEEKQMSIGGNEAKKIANSIWHSEYQRRRRRCVQSRGRGRQESMTQGQNHASSDFVALARLRIPELERLVAATSLWMSKRPPRQILPLPLDTTRRLIYASHSSISAQYLAREPTRPILYFPPTVTYEIFIRAWGMNEPVMVDCANSVAMWEPYTPAYFSERIKEHNCELLNLATSETVVSTTTSFLSMFGEKKDSSVGYKLSEWPLPEDCSTVFPDLSKAFYDLLPAPMIMRKDGIYNMAAHTPIGALSPNVGPHLLFSTASGPDAGYIPLKCELWLPPVAQRPRCTDKLLAVDDSDLVSHMVWSGGNPKFRSACWDIFRRSDTQFVRDFVIERILQTNNRQAVREYERTHDDPLMSSSHYLGPAARRELLHQKNVKSYRIWQRVGELIFIPAGCVYQVCTFEDTISLHSQIMSSQHLDQILKVQRIAREQTKEKALWRTDPQQLRPQMIWTWKSCEQIEKRNEKKWPPLTFDTPAQS